ncbi:MAG: DUF1579 domain-containing protein [Planctomycetes bacterium]|nr:DUF1579 domain-containing protein [Planctomycetota bacterium]
MASKFALSAVLFVAALAGLVRAEEKQDAAAAEMAKMMEKMQPGKEHEGLKKLEGQYDVAVKMWMEPGKDPLEGKASAEFKMVMNGRYLKQDYKGDMMGKPYTGIGYEGFDRVTGKYTSAWIDDFGTSMMTVTGASKDGGKTIEFTGEQGDCMNEGKTVKLRCVHKVVSDDQFVFEMYHTGGDGKEAKDMELTYTRKK